jgi:translocator protein
MILPIAIAAITVIFMLSFGAWMTPIGPWYRDLRKPVWNPRQCSAPRGP